MNAINVRQTNNGFVLETWVIGVGSKSEYVYTNLGELMVVIREILNNRK